MLAIPGDLGDARLIERSLLGDRAAFSLIIERYKQVVCATAFSILGDAELSRDVGQEVFVEAWRTLPSLREPARFRAWVCTIARSRSLDAVRGRARHVCEPVDEALPDDAPNPLELLAQKQTAAFVWAVVRRLPEPYRAPIVLFYREGRSIAEVASDLELSDAAARQRISRGRALVRRELERELGRSLAEGGPDDQFTAVVLAALPRGAPGAGKLFAITGVTIAIAASIGLASNMAKNETPAAPVVSVAPIARESVSAAREQPVVASSAPVVQREEPSSFGGSVVSSDGAPCRHARVWVLDAGGARYPLFDRHGYVVATDGDAAFRFESLTPGAHELEVSCREATTPIGFREVVKTYAIEVPRDEGAAWVVDLPDDFEVAPADEVVPASIAALASQQVVDEIGAEPWQDRPSAAADADGDGQVSEDEWKIHDEIASYLLTLDEQRSPE